MSKMKVEKLTLFIRLTPPKIPQEFHQQNNDLVNQDGGRNEKLSSLPLDDLDPYLLMFTK